MSGSLNKACIIGNLGQDPEVRNLPSGGKVVNLSVATSETWKDKNSGEKRERTEWHRVVIFSEGLGKVAEQYLKKGAKVYIEGQIQTRKWQDKDGADRYSTEIVLQGFGAVLTMLGGRDDAGSQREASAQAAAPAARPGTDRPGQGATSGDLDDVPF